ncbi:PEP/pyruvate-binding domain-containing protein [Kutzneria buriramensis]|uniref:Pyruvate,water dikinase n=1 Tax=Kutzneria buriramensis TaxID=1045776 RepID=A0A3E0I836_9PSEU|nr:PEP/pyruvate-binding domain-containing protein [Kutzneria buriramensis]REH54305.1 pyruvate,water dikinase [Kutzneria buriramensis]
MVTLDFSHIDGAMLVTVGGKAANLGEMTRAGLPVPPGFCVTTEAYRRVAVGVPVDDPSAARAALLGVSIPEEIAAEIRSRYEALGEDVPVAVRSSATAEDLPFASFAGQQDTYLNVVGVDAVLDAVRRCWASLWTDRAYAYRDSNGISHATVELAVVVQRMVDAEVAGVLFTANPVTGRRRQAVIDASYGLGESVVSGSVNPDHFIVDTLSGSIVERRLGDKKVAVRALPSGGTESVPVDSSEPSLSDDQIRALAALGDRVEHHYGSPQDTEWAISSDGSLWLTQARPITTLYPLPDSPSNDGRGRHAYLCATVAQGLYRPITPMGLAVFHLIGTGGRRMFGLPVEDALAGPGFFSDAGQRLYVDMTAVIRNRVGRLVVPRIFDVMEARSATAMRSLFDDPDMSLRPGAFRTVRRILRLMLRAGFPLRLVEALFFPASAARRLDALGARVVAAATLPGSPDARTRLEHVIRAVPQIPPMLPRALPVPLAGFLTLELARRLLGSGAGLETVLRGLPHNVTTEMDLELWDVAVGLRPHAALFASATPGELASRYLAGSLPSDVQQALHRFLARYGHRAVAEIDLGMPRWSDDPTHILGVLANYLRLDAAPEAKSILDLDSVAVSPSAPDVQFARGSAEASAMIAQLSASGGLRGRVVRWALRRTRRLAGLRETPKFFLVQTLAALRHQLQFVGAELAAAHRISVPDDVFFLTLAECREALSGTDFRSLVADRRASYDQELRRRTVPQVLLSDGTDPESVAFAAAVGSDSLVGTPASTGRLTGTARVVMDPVGAHLEPGEILVAPSTDPGWTPLFLTAGGLVMEMGGANSHGAVVAREYGIPAVVGVPRATSRISTGDVITIDGAAGTVTQA